MTTTVARFRHHRRKGLTLFGVLMGLTLFAAAVIGAVTLYNTAQETQDRNDAHALLTRLQVAVQQIYLGESSYPTGSLTPALDIRARSRARPGPRLAAAPMATATPLRWRSPSAIPSVLRSR